ASDGTFEAHIAPLDGRKGVRDAHPSCIVNVESKLQFRPTVLHGPPQLDYLRRHCCADGICEGDLSDAQVDALFDQSEDSLRGRRALEWTVEGSADHDIRSRCGSP